MDPRFFRPVHEVRFSGTPYDVIVTFPWESAVVVRVSLVDKTGKLVQAFEKQVSSEVFNRYKRYLPAARWFLSMLLSSSR